MPGARCLHRAALRVSRGHPNAARVLSDVARGSICMWETAARGPERPDAPRRGLAALH
jgi:hypothetical protein